MFATKDADQHDDREARERVRNVGEDGPRGESTSTVSLNSARSVVASRLTPLSSGKVESRCLLMPTKTALIVTPVPSIRTKLSDYIASPTASVNG